MFFDKKAQAANYEFPIRDFNDAVSELKSLGVVRKERGGEHQKIVATDYFKNNILNEKVLDPLPSGQPRKVEDGVVVGGTPFTLFATLDVKKNVIYGGSAASWESLLVSMYILCNTTPEGRNLRNVISKIFTRCFTTSLVNSTFFKILKIQHLFDKSNDIVINNKLLLDDYIIDYIKNFKNKINSEQKPNIIRELNMIDKNYFAHLLQNSQPENLESLKAEINEARTILERIFRNLLEAAFDKPKIIANLISDSIESDMSVITSFIEKKDQNLYTVDDFFVEYKNFLPEKISEFKEKYISDEENLDDAEIEREFKKIFKQELDNLASNNKYISKADGEKYSIIVLKDNVLRSLGRLYRIISVLEKKSILMEALKYAGG